jgi:hypothetical protein
MPPKRASEDDPQLIHKIQRIEHGVSTSPPQPVPNSSNNDFSTSVKRKLADSKRTGQACDRCKVCMRFRDHTETKEGAPSEGSVTRNCASLIPPTICALSL